MTKQVWVFVATVAVAAAGTSSLVNAQKGGKAKTPNRIAATAIFTCPPELLACGIQGDGSNYNSDPDLWVEGDPGASMRIDTSELNITIGGGYAITLDFGGQTPSDSYPEWSDCSLLDPATTCLWDWATYPQARSFTENFTIQSNTLDESGEVELAGGLLGVPVGTLATARLNMTITVPETAPGFWRFDFNPNIPPNGGATVVKVYRNDECTWTFSAIDGQKAALSILVKPPRGKQYAHREGRYQMPFVLTYQVPSLCAA